MDDLTCPGSNQPPRIYRPDTHTGWCYGCRDQHVLISDGVIPQHNRDS